MLSAEAAAPGIVIIDCFTSEIYAAAKLDLLDHVTFNIAWFILVLLSTIITRYQIVAAIHAIIGAG